MSVLIIPTYCHPQFGNIVNWEKLQTQIYNFGYNENISEEKIIKFYDYLYDNSAMYADEKDPTKLYDKNGNVMDNWKGALINFSRTNYDRKEWERKNLKKEVETLPVLPFIVIPIRLLKNIKGKVVKGKVKTLEGVFEFVNDILNNPPYSTKSGVMANLPRKAIETFNQNQQVNNPYWGLLGIHEFDGIQLIAFVALKSIICTQSYKAIKWEYVLSRMSGSAKMINTYPPHIEPYKTRRKRDKLIKGLVDNWGLKYYAKNVRTPYFTFSDIDLEKIIREKKKDKTTEEEEEEEEPPPESSKKCTPISECTPIERGVKMYTYKQMYTLSLKKCTP